LRPLRKPLACIIALAAIFVGSSAYANGRAGPTPPNINAPMVQSGAPVYAARVAWRSGSDLVNEATMYLGQSNPTGFNEAWCRDFVNMVLERTGHKLADKSHMAVAALNLGQHVANPEPGDLAVMRGHVTIFAGWNGPDTFSGLGGNQHHRVTVASFSRRSVIAFVRPT
jgi:uncharacterized protein (TIGR02594 family)